MDRQDTEERVLAALERLDDEQRDLVVMASIEGRPLAEVASRYRCSLDETRERVRLALAALVHAYHEQSGCATAC